MSATTSSAAIEERLRLAEERNSRLELENAAFRYFITVECKRDVTEVLNKILRLDESVRSLRLSEGLQPSGSKIASVEIDPQNQSRHQAATDFEELIPLPIEQMRMSNLHEESSVAQRSSVLQEDPLAVDFDDADISHSTARRNVSAISNGSEEDEEEHQGSRADGEVRQDPIDIKDINTLTFFGTPDPSIKCHLVTQDNRITIKPLTENYFGRGTVIPSMAYDVFIFDIVEKAKKIVQKDENASVRTLYCAAEVEGGEICGIRPGNDLQRFAVHCMNEHQIILDKHAFIITVRKQCKNKETNTYACLTCKHECDNSKDMEYHLNFCFGFLVRGEDARNNLKLPFVDRVREKYAELTVEVIEELQ